MIHGLFVSLKPVDETIPPDTDTFAISCLLLGLQTFMQKFINNNVIKFDRNSIRLLVGTSLFVHSLLYVGKARTRY